MILYIAYWSERYPNNVVIESFEATSVNPGSLQKRYSWSPDDITPDIYPMYRESNFGKEERCPRNKNIHYVIHESLEDLQKHVQEIIDRHICRYSEKLRDWQNIRIVLPEKQQAVSISK